MSLKWISAAWRNNLKTSVTQDHRVYFNFRQREYPTVTESSVEFALVSALANVSGSHNLKEGWGDYLLDMAPTLTVDVYFKPTFAFNTADDQFLCGWRNDAAHYLQFLYLAGSACYDVAWYDGVAERQLFTTAYLNDATLQVWTRLTASLDLTTGTNAGSELYLNGALADATWSGATDVKARNFPKFSVRHSSTWGGAYDVNYVRIFPNKKVTAAQVTNNFKDLKDEEIVWTFDGTMLGHSRCNVSSRVSALGIRRTRNSLNGGGSPAEARVELMSHDNAAFSDDTYAEFVPANEYYNGTSAQKYLQAAVPMEIETWYGGAFESEFRGRVNSSYFKRAVTANDITRVGVSATDKTTEIANKTKRRATYYENKKLSDAVETDSLVHLIGRLVTRTEWYNFLSNASFEITTVTSSWAGVNGTVTQQASGLIGTYCGQMEASVSATVYQAVTFTGTKCLTPAQNWNFSLYLSCATTRAGVIHLAGYASTVLTESATAAWSLTGGAGWNKAEVEYTVGTSSINCLRATVSVTGSATISMDGAMLVQNNRALDWFIPHTGEGASGVISADVASCSSFDTVGFDTDAVNFTHPWALVPQEEPILGHLLDIGTATVARRINLDAAGTLVYRSPLKVGYADPTPLLTVTTVVDMVSAVEERQGNKLIVHGVDYVKTEKAVKIWDAEGSGFPSSTTHTVCVSVVAGATFPDNVKSAVFWMEWLK